MGKMSSGKKESRGTVDVNQGKEEESERRNKKKRMRCKKKL